MKPRRNDAFALGDELMVQPPEALVVGADRVVHRFVDERAHNFFKGVHGCGACRTARCCAFPLRAPNADLDVLAMVNIEPKKVCAAREEFGYAHDGPSSTREQHINHRDGFIQQRPRSRRVGPLVKVVHREHAEPYIVERRRSFRGHLRDPTHRHTETTHTR